MALNSLPRPQAVVERLPDPLRRRLHLLTLRFGEVVRQAGKPWFQFLLGQRVSRLRRKGKPIRLVIGAGPTTYRDWIITDLPVLDALRPADWRHIFRPGEVDRILAEHVVEHWTEDEFRHFLSVVKPYLSWQGRIRIAVPDGFHPHPAYIEEVKPGGTGCGADDHKVLYNYRTMTALLSEEGYEAKLLEYFDAAGQFHRTEWSSDDGFIMRSADHDPRNKERPLSYQPHCGRLPQR